MEHVVSDILDALRSGQTLDAQALDQIIRAHSKKAHDGRRVFAKKHVLPFYLEQKRCQNNLWKSWNVDDELDRSFVRTLQMKPRRTASGVATITVITKPWPCSGNCIYCPNDIRMPKSYLSDEPACQRAERNWFDPYLQVSARLNTLNAMGHATDKIELIVLGGTWSDYPTGYQTWFICEMLEALNDSDEVRQNKVDERRNAYETAGIANDPEELAKRTSEAQDAISAGMLSYAKAWHMVYGQGTPWDAVSAWQFSEESKALELQAVNESADHRVVGLVVETRPDSISTESLTRMRMLGCTKIQLGIQSLDETILAQNGRTMSTDVIANALDEARLFGFKTHVHIMVNLAGSTPESDVDGYRMLVEDPRFRPDEVKLYPLALVENTPMCQLYENGSWKPYAEEELVDVLSSCMIATPPFTRISRMIRDISAKDILVGNKKTNLRQMVESSDAVQHADIKEIRFREVGTSEVVLEDLTLDCVRYKTTSTDECFLQLVDHDGRIAGFLRLSLPHAKAISTFGNALPIREGEAMIRELHVYGFAEQLHASGATVQHHGFGSKLIERACSIAREEGYHALNVISAIGTRAYYRNRGFEDAGLYQRRPLI